MPETGVHIKGLTLEELEHEEGAIRQQIDALQAKLAKVQSEYRAQLDKLEHRRSAAQRRTSGLPTLAWP